MRSKTVSIRCEVILLTTERPVGVGSKSWHCFMVPWLEIRIEFLRCWFHHLSLVLLSLLLSVRFLRLRTHHHCCCSLVLPGTRTRWLWSVFNISSSLHCPQRNSFQSSMRRTSAVLSWCIVWAFPLSFSMQWDWRKVTFPASLIVRPSISCSVRLRLSQRWFSSQSVLSRGLWLVARWLQSDLGSWRSCFMK